jgi:predicted SAM-dependent methyltransferase
MGQCRKLHLGCGGARVDGFLNVDASPYSRGADLVCRLESLDRVYPRDNAELIYACHVLEHFSHAEAEHMLGVFYRLLRPGGELRISVPDMDRIVKIYSNHWDHFQTPGNSPWIGLIFGGQTDDYDFHKTGFNFCWLKYLLERNGFREIHEYPHEPHFLGIRDASLAKEPFGEYLSLNVSARK